MENNTKIIFSNLTYPEQNSQNIVCDPCPILGQMICPTIHCPNMSCPEVKCLKPEELEINSQFKADCNERNPQEFITNKCEPCNKVFLTTNICIYFL